MAKVSGVQIARWSASAGWRTPNLEVAVAIGLANGSDPAKPGGVWGVGGPSGDGAGQAVAAHAQWKTQGWDEFAVWRSNAWQLYLPSAVAAIGVAGVAGAASAAGDVAGRGADAAATAAAAPFQPAIDVVSYVGTDEFWNRTIKIGLGVSLLVIAAASLAWTMGARPVFEAVGIVDRKISEQLPLAEGQTLRPRHVANTATP